MWGCIVVDGTSVYKQVYSPRVTLPIRGQFLCKGGQVQGQVIMTSQSWWEGIYVDEQKDEDGMEIARSGETDSITPGINNGCMHLSEMAVIMENLFLVFKWL